LARNQRRELAIHAALEVFGMHALCPSGADLLFHGAPGKLEPAVIEELAQAVRASHPQQHGSVIGHGAKASFTLAEHGIDNELRRGTHDAASLVLRRDCAACSRSFRARETELE